MVDRELYDAVERSFTEKAFVANINDAIFIADKDDCLWYRKSFDELVEYVIKAHGVTIPHYIATDVARKLVAQQKSIDSYPAGARPPMNTYTKSPMNVIAYHNGYVENGEFYPYTEHTVITDRLDADFMPHATVPNEYQKVLYKWVGKEQYASLVWMIGYWLSGHADLKKFATFVGPTNSGKTTCAKFIAWLLGDNASFTSVNVLTTQFGTASLRDRSLLILDEAALVKASNRVWQDFGTLVRSIVSGESVIDVNQKHERVRKDAIKTRLIFTSNSYLSDPLNTPGWAERQITLDFENDFSTTRDGTIKPNIALHDEFASIKDQIINWHIQYYLERRRKGTLTEPASSLAVAQRLMNETSEFMQFITETYEIGDQQSFVSTRDLCQAYADWSGESTQNLKAFGRMVKQELQDQRLRGINFHQKKVDRKNCRGYRGLKRKSGNEPQPTVDASTTVTLDTLDPNRVIDTDRATELLSI